MSFLIVVYVNEGIVLASDRRTTYTNTQNIGDKEIVKIGVHTTNSTDKTFKCPNDCGISTCGDASLLGKPITGYIQAFIREKVLKDTIVDEIPQMLIDYFNTFESVPETNFIVAGYQKDNTQAIQKIYKIQIKNKNIELIDTNYQGATWDGETLTLIRVTQKCAIKNDNGTYLDLQQNDILWNYFTLQDAIDFAMYAVETTIKTMHFQNVIETVGGNVDILVITPDDTKWLQKAELQLS